jgi:very-short-patch-repair endonuclease
MRERPEHHHTKPELWQHLKPLARQMRHEPTLAENVLWQHIRGRKLKSAKFRRQHAIERFIVDFFCYEAKLIIEVDGEIHQYTHEEDAIRQEFLESQSFIVIRFTNEEILKQLQAVLERIATYLSDSFSDSPSPNGEGAGG